MSSTTIGPPASADDLFDGSQYQLPIPEIDGHKADTLRITIGGGLDLDLYDEQALAFLETLKLGRDLELTITVKVTGNAWRHTVKGEDETEHVIHQIALKAHSLQLPDTDA